MTFLDRLDLLMSTLGINKSKLSQISGVPYTTIDAFYKKGYQNAKISTLRKLAVALGVSLDYLIVDETEENNAPPFTPLSPEALSIATAYECADDKSRRMARLALEDFMEADTPRNVHDWTDAEMHAELQRQLDAEKEETDEPSTGSPNVSGADCA